MFKLFAKKKEEENNNNHLSLISVTALLIHSAKIDQNFTEKERNIIKKALVEMGADKNNIDETEVNSDITENSSEELNEISKTEE